MSGLLKNLLPGDVVLAGRGFNIGNSVGFYCASLQIPAFTKGRKQLSAYEVAETRKIANLRIHVESHRFSQKKISDSAKQGYAHREHGNKIR